MTWTDYGLIFKVDKLESWAVSHCYVPTAIELADRIRVYAAFWDDRMYGRLGFVDIDKTNPTKILGYSQTPLLKDSLRGSFDCDGVTPLSVINDGEKIRLYYAGWKKFDNPYKRYTLFTGLAVGDLSGNNFERYKSTPIIGPRNNAEIIRTGGFVCFENNKWLLYYACSNGFYTHENKIIPSYSLNRLCSDDGLNWDDNSEEIIFPTIEGKVMGYGRSAIWKRSPTQFTGLIPVRSWNGTYSNILFTESNDGFNWNKLSINGMAFLSSHTIDNQKEVTFPSLVHQKNRILMFYNGNEFGKDGLRLAIWEY